VIFIASQGQASFSTNRTFGVEFLPSPEFEPTVLHAEVFIQWFALDEAVEQASLPGLKELLANSRDKADTQRKCKFFNEGAVV
jgi:hypothetical protein